MAVSAPEAALLVASILGRDLAIVDRAVEACAEPLGRLLFVSEPLAFAYTNYYEDELGPQPARRIVAFDRLGDSSQLPDIKRQTCRLEVALGSAHRHGHFACSRYQATVRRSPSAKSTSG